MADIDNISMIDGGVPSDSAGKIYAAPEVLTPTVAMR